jgi:hypothetical protein
MPCQANHVCKKPLYTSLPTSYQEILMNNDFVRSPSPSTTSITVANVHDEPMVSFVATIPASMRGELALAVREMACGISPRTRLIEIDREAISNAGMRGLQTLSKALDLHPGTGQCRTIARFLAALYNGYEYCFDLTYLRGIDTELANACLAFLNFDRLGIDEVHNYLPGGAKQLNRWFEENGVEPKAR